MRKVIMIGQEPKEKSKGVKFTHYLSCSEGWCETGLKACDFDKIVYLGECDIDGDMFAVYSGETIGIYKGKLNNGTY